MEREITYEDINVFKGETDFDKAVQALLYYKGINHKAFINFNGCIIHTSQIENEDSAYLIRFGKTKQEKDEERKQSREAYLKSEEEETLKALDNSNEWIERGENLTYKELREGWANTVIESTKSPYHGEEIEVSLKLMEALERGEDIDAICETFDRRCTIMMGKYVGNIVTFYSKRGAEFYETYMRKTHKIVTSEIRETVEKLQERNQRYEENEKAKKQTLTI